MERRSMKKGRKKTVRKVARNVLAACASAERQLVDDRDFLRGADRLRRVEETVSNIRFSKGDRNVRMDVIQAVKRVETLVSKTKNQELAELEPT